VIEVNFDIAGDLRVRHGFERLGREAGDLRDPLERVEQLILADVEQDFATHGGGRWRPLDPAYEAWKTREFGPGLDMMVLTGELKRELTSPAAVRVAGNRLVYDAPVDAFKLEDRPVFPDVRGRQVDDVFDDWLSEIVTEAFKGRE
jgi:hypothetical protein